jgi:hypothetical protein
LFAVDITSRYFQEVKLKNKGLKNIESIVYGSENVGYFETKNFEAKRLVRVIDLLPPTYKEPIKFFAKLKKKNKTVFLGEKEFENPTPKAIASIQPYYKTGKLTQNFLVFSASIPKVYLNNLEAENVQPDTEKKNGNRFTFLMAVNRHLEIIWAYAPHRDKVPFYSYVAFREIDKNKYGFVLGKKDGLYATVDIKGTILDGVDGTANKKKFPMHHDFTYKDKNTLLTFSNRYAKMRDLQRNKKLFLTNTVLSIDLKKNKVRKAFDFIKFMRPLTVGYWQENKFKPRWVVWDNVKADHDFVHANSMEFYKGKGLLVSLKHLDKIVMIDEDLDKILWTVGPTKKDTFQATGPLRFSHQHDAKLLENGDILLFDNGFMRKESRALAFKLNKKTNRIEKSWEFSPKPKLYAENRGGVSPLPNGLFMAHFVSPAGRRYSEKTTMDQDMVYIFDPVKKKIICELILPFRTRSAGYRSFSFDTLGDENYLGESLSGLQKGA